VTGDRFVLVLSVVVSPTCWGVDVYDAAVQSTPGGCSTDGKRLGECASLHILCGGIDGERVQ